MSRSIKMLLKLSPYVSKKTLAINYFVLVNWHLCYENFMGKRRPFQFIKTNNLQKRSSKFILGNNGFSNDINGVLNLKNLNNYSCSTKFYKCYCMGSDQRLTIELSKLQANPNYNTRHNANDNLNVPQYPVSRC